MAKLEQRPKVQIEFVIRLNEAEARFLEGLAGFDHQKLLEHLRQFAGKCYTEDRARPDGVDGAGLLSFLTTCQELGPALDRYAILKEQFYRDVFQIKE